MFPTLQLGPLAIQAPGLILIVGLWLGLTLAERYASIFGVAASHIYNLVFLALVFGLVGARLAYLLRYPSAFENSPLSILSINTALLDPAGGAVAALVASLIYGQRKGMKLLPTLDALTPLMAVMLISISVANLSSGNAFGAPTEMPWGIQLWGENRHPTQVYEILSSSLLLAVFWPSRKMIHAWPPGVYFLGFLASSAGLYLFLQAFRGDSPVLSNGLRIPQIVAWFILAGSLILIGRLLNGTQEAATNKLNPLEE